MPEALQSSEHVRVDVLVAPSLERFTSSSVDSVELLRNLQMYVRDLLYDLHIPAEIEINVVPGAGSNGFLSKDYQVLVNGHGCRVPVSRRAVEDVSALHLARFVARD